MKRIIIFFAILILAYLSGAFGNASFNIADWSEYSRVIVAVLGLFIASMIATCTFLDDLK